MQDRHMSGERSGHGDRGIRARGHEVRHEDCHEPIRALV